ATGAPARAFSGWAEAPTANFPIRGANLCRRPRVLQVGFLATLRAQVDGSQLQRPPVVPPVQEANGALQRRGRFHLQVVTQNPFGPWVGPFLSARVARDLDHCPLPRAPMMLSRFKRVCLLPRGSVARTADMLAVVTHTRSLILSSLHQITNSPLHQLCGSASLGLIFLLFASSLMAEIPY